MVTTTVVFSVFFYWWVVGRGKKCGEIRVPTSYGSETSSEDALHAARLVDAGMLGCDRCCDSAVMLLILRFNIIRYYDTAVATCYSSATE